MPATVSWHLKETIVEKIEFSGKYLSFRSRIIKNALPIILMVAFFSLIFISKNISENIGWKFSTMLILAAVVPIGNTLLQCKNLVTSINVANGKIRFTGYTFNMLWTKEFSVNETTVSIESLGRTDKVYFLKFNVRGNTFLINKLKTWNYTELVNLFRTFKAAKNEKVIFDDEYWLDVMEKMEKGMTAYRAVMSKGKTNAS